MVSIRIGRWLLQSDPHCWVVGKYSTRTYKGGRVAEEVKDPKYPANLKSALNSLLDRELRESDARSLEELARVVESFEREVKDALREYHTLPRVA